ncbi:MAG: transglutaminase-like domain-containing protein [Bacillota bacterium]|nr:transglutaminase-like domain-containing protein [Bacillota bacterium]
MKKKKKALIVCGCILAVTLAFAACSEPSADISELSSEDVYLAGSESEEMIFEEAAILADTPVANASAVLEPVASGVNVLGNDKCEIDASNVAEGYVMVRYTGGGSKKIKLLMTNPSGVQYQYNLKLDGDWGVFPLSGGNGVYKLGVYQNTSGNKYSTLFTTSVTAQITNAMSPFLYPNQYVNFTANSAAVAKAKEICSGKTAELDKVSAIYNFVINNLSYDKQKAQSVQSGYLPDIDAVLAAKKGICFDYAALMAAMLRSQNVPTKLVVGYTGAAYHAWINVHISGQGWVNGVIYFDGSTWKLMDPTFASSANSSDAIMQYIGNGSNYQAKYQY